MLSFIQMQNDDEIKPISKCCYEGEKREIKSSNKIGSIIRAIIIVASIILVAIGIILIIVKHFNK